MKVGAFAMFSMPYQGSHYVDRSKQFLHWCTLQKCTLWYAEDNLVVKLMDLIVICIVVLYSDLHIMHLSMLLYALGFKIPRDLLSVKRGKLLACIIQNTCSLVI